MRSVKGPQATPCSVPRAVLVNSGSHLSEVQHDIRVKIPVSMSQSYVCRKTVKCQPDKL